MSQLDSTTVRLTPEPLPDNLASVQPGSGFCYRVELAWGRLRRWYLKTFRAAYGGRRAGILAAQLDRIGLAP